MKHCLIKNDLCVLKIRFVLKNLKEIQIDFVSFD